MFTRALTTTFLSLVLISCGGAKGTIAGKVTVEGGNSGGVPVIAYGPLSGAAATNEAGGFSITGLPDGDYIVKAVVRGAEVEERQVSVKISGGATSGEANLVFKMPVGKVTGKVIFSNAEDSSNLSVLLTGAVTRATKTQTGGTFNFEGLPTGTYVASVEVPQTREGRIGVGVGVADGTPVDLGVLKFTPVGTVTGTVLSAMMGVARAQVAVSGTDVSTLTDDMGKFVLRGVETGMRTVVATAGERVATQTVDVSRTAEPDVMLTLAVQPPPTGTVRGVITFAGTESPTLIKVAAPAVPSVMPSGVGPNGAYSLTLPVGTWELFASAPNYGSRSIGSVTVFAGQTTLAPSTELSLYDSYFRALGVVSSVNVTASCSTAVGWSAVTMIVNGQTQLWLINALTRERRLLYIGAYGSPVFSNSCAQFAFTATGGASGDALLTYTIGSGLLTNRGTRGNIGLVDFSSDETVIFVWWMTLSLERIPLATGIGTQFNTTASAGQWVLRHTQDRYLVRNATDVKLVTPTTDMPLFSNVTSVSATPVPWALTNCAATLCDFKIVAATGTTPSTVSSALITTVTSVTQPPALGGGLGAQNARFPVFIVTSGATTRYHIVDASNGMAQPLPVGTYFAQTNIDGSRLFYGTNVAATKSVFEEFMPPFTGNAAAFSTTSGNFAGGYIAKNRLVLMDSGTTPTNARVIDAKGTDGVVLTVTPTNDVNAATFTLFGSGTAWLQSSTGKFRVVVANGDVTSVGLGLTTPVQTPTLRAPPVALVPHPPYAVLGTNSPTLGGFYGYFVDSGTTTVTQLVGLTPSTTPGTMTESPGPINVAADWWFPLNRPSGHGSFLVGNATKQVIEVDEPLIANRLFLTAAGKVSAVLAVDQRDSRQLLWATLGQ